jgi:hypothetical protein
MSEPDPYFCAYADEADKAEALVDAMSALFTRALPPFDPYDNRKIKILTRDIHDHVSTTVSRSDLSLEEMVDLVRQHFSSRSSAGVQFSVRLPSRPWYVSMGLDWDTVGAAGDERPVQGLTAWPYGVLRTRYTEVAASHEKCPVPVGAALMARNDQQDVESVLARLCASPRIKTGAVTLLFRDHGDDYLPWTHPLEMSATYNADGHVERDVALSWLYLHNGDKVHYVAGMSLDEMAARVETAPKGTTIGLAPTPKLVFHHFSVTDNIDPKGLPFNSYRLGPRKRSPQDEELSREQVLAILKTPPETLLGALEAAAAIPDPLWLDAERRALEVIEAAKKAEDKVEIHLDTYEHRCFLELHAPYHVRRLDNGGVMIATHPYRHLWPLWADALALLGIRPG